MSVSRRADMAAARERAMYATAEFPLAVCELTAMGAPMKRLKNWT